MSIIRIKKEREYVSIANAILQDKNLSWEARGVMAYLLSKPDGWECRNYDLVNQGPAGKHIIQRVMKELQGAGYIHRYQKSDGHKIEWVTEIYETPELNTTSRNTDIPPAEEPTVRKAAGRESGHIVSTDSQQVLNTEKTDLNGSAKNSQTQNPKYTFSERQALNKLAPIFATQCGDQFSKDELKNYIKNIIGASLKSLQDLARAALIIEDYSDKDEILKSFQIWWYNEYWLGRDKGQPPTPAQVGDTWGQFEAAQSTPTSSAGPELSDVAKANYKRLLAQQTK
jgi:hypothetical protein